MEDQIKELMGLVRSLIGTCVAAGARQCANGIRALKIDNQAQKGQA